MDSTLLTAASFLARWEEAEGETPEGFTLVHEGEWGQEHKDQYKETVYRHDETGRFFEVLENRRGSPWSDWDWDYGDPDCYEVVPEVQTVTVYVVKKVPQ